METATLAGGCFWCTEAIFRRLKGVKSVVSGYAGKGEKPTYETVSTGRTGFAEAVRIEFDPKVISFERILDIFWAVHDPTTLDRQGADVGTQYRSAIFYHNDEQREIAEKSKAKMEKTGIIKDEIVTEIAPFEKFYEAEEYHQKFYDRNIGSNVYCSLVISPKIQKLLDKFNKEVKEEYK